MIDEISSLNRKIAVLKDEFIAIQNDLNSLYWPRLAKIKKKMKDYTWYLLLSLCLFITVIIGVISNIIRNEALIIICLVITFLLVCLLAFVVRRVYKKKEKANKEWDKEKIPMNEKKKLMDELMEKSKELMIKYIIEEEGQEVIDEIGTAYDDLLEHFEHLMNEL